MKRQKALITPSVIKWAREKAHYSLDVSAKKVGVKSQQMEEWENGKSLPTMTQARKMSKVYRRPLAAFYLSNPPRDFPLLKDFRTVGGESPEYSSALVFLMRQFQERQVWLKEYLIEQGYETLSFIESKLSSSSPEELSKSIIKTILGEEREYYQNNNLTAEQTFNHWLAKCEEKGIFISRTSLLNSRNTISVKEARGFVISDKHAPFIFINSGDSKKAQLFTLIHELAHLWLGCSGVPDHFSINYKSRKASTEFLCNQTAAEILMPTEKIRNFSKMKSIEEVKNFIKIHHKEFPVSELAFLVRLKSFSLINKKIFESLKNQYEKEYEQHQIKEKNKLKKKKDQNPNSGPNSNSLKLIANGKSFTRIVAFSYKEGVISGREASGLLDMKLNRVEKMIKMLG